MKTTAIFVALIATIGCAEQSQPNSEKATMTSANRLTTINYELRKIDNFRKITRDMTNSEIFELVGPPDRDIGSGLFIYEYSLEDNTVVLVGSTGNNVIYVRYKEHDLLAGAG